VATGEAIQIKCLAAVKDVLFFLQHRLTRPSEPLDVFPGFFSRGTALVDDLDDGDETALHPPLTLMRAN
jgi:hypothetical protein